MEELSLEAEASLLSLKSQYFQLVEPQTIEFPLTRILQQPAFQSALYERLFSPTASPHPPPDRYTSRVLKRLISLLEEPASEEEEEAPELNDSLLTLYITLHTPAPLAPTTKSPATYTLPAPHLPITLLETPSLISGLGTTGLRTWEAAQALSEYILLHPPTAETRLLELGAGTGLVSLTAARVGVRDVVATDGDEGVCDGLRENVKINVLQEQVRVQRRMWAGPREVPEVVDMVVGADVTYDAAAIPFLVAELVWLFSENQGLCAIISATIRNEETFAVFRGSCEEAGLRLKESVWTLPSPRVFWYVPRAEIRIVEVSVDRRDTK